MTHRHILLAFAVLQTALLFTGVSHVTADPGSSATASSAAPSFEVWLVDQSNSLNKSYGGTIYVFDGPQLMGDAADKAQPSAIIDLGLDTAALCQAATETFPTRPHMILFNPEHTHAILSFVATGHVVIFNAATRAPVACLRASVGDAGARQAHAAIPSPDGSFILVANQNGKLLERIDAQFATNQYAWNHAARLDLVSCVTPSGAACQSASTRPDNAPICPIIESQGRLSFVTLRGGGLLVVDATTSPMSIVAEYDKNTVHGNGCGGIQVQDRMFVNSGGGTSSNLFQYDLYSFSVSQLASATSTSANTPAPELLFTDEAQERDAHGMVAVGSSPYLWMFDRGSHVFDVFDAVSGGHLAELPVALGEIEPTPDLADVAPAGNRVFVSLRGPNPLSGDSHVSHGTLPGMAVMQVTAAGTRGAIKAIIPITNKDANGVERADAHGIRVRLRP